MAVTPIKGYADTALDTLFAHAALKNLANGAELTSAEIDNTASGDRIGSVVLAISWATAPAAGVRCFDIYVIYAIDGTNYASVGADGLPGPNDFVGSVVARVPTTNALDLMELPWIPLLPLRFKVVISNVSGQAVANDDDVTMFVKMQRSKGGSGS